MRGTEARASARRRRRTPEAAQAEIIRAAEGLLRERPFRELTVDEVMRRTGLSRPSFYVYFKDRHELVWRVVQDLEGLLLTESNLWFEREGAGKAREALRGIVDVYAEHSGVLRALADAAADDPDVEEAYTGLVQRFIDITAEHIRAEIAAGRVTPLNACETAKALLWMNERYLYLSLGSEPRTPVETVSETLQTIWIRTLYGCGQAPGRGGRPAPRSSRAG